MKKKKDLAYISEPLRDALFAYSSLESDSADPAAVAQRLFGPAATRILLPQLDRSRATYGPAMTRGTESAPLKLMLARRSVIDPSRPYLR